jgi:hypothetical protein
MITGHVIFLLDGCRTLWCGMAPTAVTLATSGA